MAVKSPTRKARKKPPAEWKSFSDVLAADRDNVGRGRFWMIANHREVSLQDQLIGEAPTQEITIPADTFRRFAAWYMTGRLPRVGSRKGKGKKR